MDLWNDTVRSYMDAGGPKRALRNRGFASRSKLAEGLLIGTQFGFLCPFLKNQFSSLVPWQQAAQRPARSDFQRTKDEVYPSDQAGWER